MQIEAGLTAQRCAGTFDLARLQAYQRLGVQRFSVGVQAFDEVRCWLFVQHERFVWLCASHVVLQELLKACGRSHSLQVCLA